jgi:hypothetical protein
MAEYYVRRGMAEYHVRRGLVGIYAGTLKKNGEEWQNKTDVTTEAIWEVGMYLLENGTEVRFGQGNDLYSLRVSKLVGGDSDGNDKP